MTTAEAVLAGLLSCQVVVVVLVSVTGLVTRTARDHEQTQRQDRNIARLERKIDRIVRHLGIQESSGDDPFAGMSPVLRSIASGNKIALIKLYREQTGAGLKEAKDAVEAMQREMELGQDE